MSNGSFGFGPEFEQDLLSVAVNDKTFLRDYSEVVSPEFFDDAGCCGVATAVRGFWEKHRTTPNVHDLQLFLSGEGASDVGPLLPMFYDREVSSPSFIKGRAIEFAKTKALSDALIQCAALVKAGESGNSIKGIMGKAFLVGEGRGGEGHDYKQELVRRVKSLREVPRVVPTGFAELDGVLDEGGLGLGEMGLVQAPPGFGKTALLVNFGKFALIAGQCVYHFSLEVSEKKLARRYDQCITGMTKEQMMRKSRTAVDLVTSQVKGGHLVIKHFPTKSANSGHVDAFIEGQVERGKRSPDLIIVDYGEIMAPEVRRGSRWEEIDENYEALRSLAGKWDCPLWTGSQTTKGAIGVDLSDMRHTGGSHGKNKTADVIVTINGNLTVDPVMPVTLYGAKNREGASGWEIACDFRRNTQQFVVTD